MLKTPARKAKEARDKRIAGEYRKLIARGAMKTAAQQYLTQKYGIARSTFWKIHKRQPPQP